ncbi:ribosomal protein S21 [Cryptococcus neoformans C23]|uniref:Ribosomal protein S21 n=2 Tax=Cryptococcus neoformans TaxID=5207 RepID=A0A854Q6P6_CRYNE|nr:small subunit ribosomal protein S21 [Cryptococcus neoformans var. grubii H99]AUB26612.1 small subunit ribosomal protein S21 [Cryptococcus neoformans var. grubii]OWZ29760.1 ribosomal protein S21 [Cryptococcus neoformans var. grubii AD2-60a]OWZ41632.1 ribosomal protein S21 [Cryptococcus neoformans var. grubii C23]OXG16637.1 ribosomal protein S21 [Cryptococcus neoformans var. grubii Tu259-1]OXG35956.1 ribosomal protein S21 [Cryptococcus neoformans var. grubii Bt15]OXG38443.1 ribosomal protein|eukprot:XP_012051262.1 small subunit ribosomal protein S21 [Cryptococcus neoformans var. grubii H99]
MSFLFRSTLRASTSRLPAGLPISTSRPLAFLPLPLSRLNSSLSTPPFSSATKPSSPPQNPINPKFAELTSSLSIPISSTSKPHAAAAAADPTSEDWWMTLSKKSHYNTFSSTKSFHPTKYFSGRSIELNRGTDFLVAYKRMQGVMRMGNMKKEAKLNEFHEKPSVRRRRLRSERHRRRFKEMVRSKVQQALAMRSRA